MAACLNCSLIKIEANGKKVWAGRGLRVGLKSIAHEGVD